MSLWSADFITVEGMFDATINFPEGVIDRHSVVLMSITELEQPQGEPLDYPHKGLAVFTLHNVVPYDDGHVKVTIDTGWNEFPINVRCYISVEGDA